MAYSLRISPYVWEWAHHTALYYEEVVRAHPDVVQRFFAQLEDALLGLEFMPKRFRVISEIGCRRAFLKTYPYVLLFEVPESSTVINVFGMVHDRMDTQTVLRVVANGRESLNVSRPKEVFTDD